MGNRPFDRQIINVRERPQTSELNLVGSYFDLTIRDTLKSMFSQRVGLSSDVSLLPTTASFIGDAFKISPLSPASRRVIVSSGLGIVSDSGVSQDIQSIAGLNDSSNLKLLPLRLGQVFEVPAGEFRVDIIEVKTSAYLTDETTVKIFNGSSGVFEPQLRNKTFSYSLDGQVGYVNFSQDSTAAISYKTGSNSGDVPDVTPGYTKLGEIHVGSLASPTITESSIIDSRRWAMPSGQAVVSGKIKLPRTALYENNPASLPELVSLSAPPGVRVGCYYFEEGNLNTPPPDPPPFTLDTFEIVLPCSYEHASVQLQLEGFNRLQVEIPQQTANDYVEQSYKSWIKYVTFVSEIGITRQGNLANPVKTLSPLSLNKKQPAILVGFSFKYVYEIIFGQIVPAIPDQITDPVFVHFSIYI